MTATITDRIYGESSGVAVKAPVVAVALTNNALSGLSAIGGYVPNEGDRILLTAQTDPTANGIYNASASTWNRSGDFDGAYDFVQGTMVVLAKPNGQGPFWQLTTPQPVIGSTPMTFVPYNPQGNLVTQTFQGGPTDGENIFINRIANYSGGQVTVNAAVLFQTDVTNPAAASYEWTVVAILNNHANWNVAHAQPQNVAINGTARQYNALGAQLWGANFVVIDYTTSASGAGKGGMIGTEVDNYFNGADLGNSRIGVLVVAGDANFNGPNPGIPGTAGYANYAIQIGSQWGISGGTQGAQCQFANGVVVLDLSPYPAAYSGAAFQSNASSTYAFRVLNSPAIGLDISQATPVTAAIRLAAGQGISWDINSTNRLFYDGTGLGYYTGASPVARLNADGSIAYGSGSSLPIKMLGTVAASATAGTNGDVPAQVAGYKVEVIGGVTSKVPYYNA